MNKLLKNLYKEFLYKNQTIIIKGPRFLGDELRSQKGKAEVEGMVAGVLFFCERITEINVKDVIDTISYILNYCLIDSVLWNVSEEINNKIIEATCRFSVVDAYTAVHLYIELWEKEKSEMARRSFITRLITNGVMQEFAEKLIQEVTISFEDEPDYMMILSDFALDVITISGKDADTIERLLVDHLLCYYESMDNDDPEIEGLKETGSYDSFVKWLRFYSANKRLVITPNGVQHKIIDRE